MRKIWIILLGVVALGVGLYFAWLNGWLPNPIGTQIEKLAKQEVTQDATAQFAVLSSRAEELGNQAKNVLGSSVQVNEETPPLHERAIEYGQYVYCKQVVTQYETQTE